MEEKKKQNQYRDAQINNKKIEKKNNFLPGLKIWNIFIISSILLSNVNWIRSYYLRNEISDTAVFSCLFLPSLFLQIYQIRQ